MSSQRLITRREMLITGLTGMGGLLLSSCSRQMPGTYGNLLRYSDNLTYATHRAVLPNESLVREYTEKDISSFPATVTVDRGDPALKYSSEEYRRLRAGGFADWRLPIEGLVEKLRVFSLAELKSFPPRTQITRHVCEDGWSAIAQ